MSTQGRQVKWKEVLVKISERTRDPLRPKFVCKNNIKMSPKLI